MNNSHYPRTQTETETGALGGRGAERKGVVQGSKAETVETWEGQNMLRELCSVTNRKCMAGRVSLQCVKQYTGHLSSSCIT